MSYSFPFCKQPRLQRTIILLACATLVQSFDQTVAAPANSASKQLFDRRVNALKIAFERKHYKECVEEAQKLRMIDPGNAFVYSLEGTALFRMEKPEQAVPVLEKSLQLDPNQNPGVYETLVECFLNTEQFPKARRLLKIAIARQPTAQLYRQVGQQDFKEGRTAEAIAAADKGIKIEPNNFWSHQDRYHYYCKLKDYNKALIDAQEMVRINPTDCSAYTMRSKVYEKLGMKAQSEADKAKASKLAPDAWF